MAEGTLQDQLSDPSKSALKRYQMVAIGSESLWQLIKYELLMLFISGLPGALGLVLRKKLYPFVLGKVGRNVIFGRGMTIRHGHKIVIGDDVVIDDGVVLDAKGEGNTGIIIESGAFISRNAVLSCKNGNISLGKNTVVGINNVVHAMEGSSVKVGDDVLIAAFVYLIGSGPYGTSELDVPFKKQGMIAQGGIDIANNVWIGSGAQVFDGVSIGTGSIIAASTVVNKDVQPYSVVAGVPMRLIKNRKDI